MFPIPHGRAPRPDGPFRLPDHASGTARRPKGAAAFACAAGTPGCSLHQSQFAWAVQLNVDPQGKLPEFVPAAT